MFKSNFNGNQNSGERSSCEAFSFLTPFFSFTGKMNFDVMHSKGPTKCVPI